MFHILSNPSYVKLLLNTLGPEGDLCLQGNQGVINLYNRYSHSNDLSTHNHLFLAPAMGNMEPLLSVKCAQLESQLLTYSKQENKKEECSIEEPKKNKKKQPRLGYGKTLHKQLSWWCPFKSWLLSSHSASCCWRKKKRLRTTFPCMAVDYLAHVMVRLFPAGRAKKKKTT